MGTAQTPAGNLDLTNSASVNDQAQFTSYQQLLFPAIAVVVGLHFFPMPPLYRHRANRVTGACMVIWAILCPLLFHGDAMIGYLALGTGLMLWAGSAWALKTASGLLLAAGL